MATKQFTGIPDRALKAIWHEDGRRDLDALFGAGFKFRNLCSLDDMTDLSGLRQRIACVRSAHPGGHLEVKDIMDLGDLVTVWWLFEAGQERQALRTPRASRREQLEGTCMFRLQEGKVVEMWELGGELEEMHPC